ETKNGRLRFVRIWRRIPYGRRTVEHGGGGRDGPHSVQGRRASHAGPSGRAGDVVLFCAAHGHALCGTTPAHSAGDDGPEAAGLSAGYTHCGRIGLSGIRGAELVRLHGPGCDAGTHTGSLE